MKLESDTLNSHVGLAQKVLELSWSLTLVLFRLDWVLSSFSGGSPKELGNESMTSSSESSMTKTL